MNSIKYFASPAVPRQQIAGVEQPERKADNLGLSGTVVNNT